MLTAEIISVGTELLMGQILNTNTRYIAEKLCSIGVAVNYESVVGDNSERLAAAAEEAIKRSDVVIFTGGLGPTKDDLTKETVAKVLGLELKLHEPSLEAMLRYFERVGRAMCESNIKQAFIPQGAQAIANTCGTAPGCIIEKGGKIIILLPGPPREMETMFDSFVMPKLKKLSGAIMSSRVLRLCGIGESAAAEKIDDLIENQTNPTIAPYAKEGEVTLRITAAETNELHAAQLMEKTVAEIYSRLGDYIYGEGEDNSMAKVVVNLLKEKGLRLSTAESCTGGLISQMITSVPGASEVFGYGFSTYANEAKVDLLGVSARTIKDYGAVSKQAACEMALGALRASGADIAVSVTGVSGPAASENKPVGLVWCAVATKKGIHSVKFNNTGGRDAIRARSAMYALNEVRKIALDL
ncbi:MAG: competence/damage-inducible protein A [Clostridia bacterium]|nr:competence/damage-inducible protein A [Clostridia bacterium]